MKRDESIRAAGGTRKSDRPAESGRDAPGSPGQPAAPPPPWLEASSASEAGSYLVKASVPPPKEEGTPWRPCSEYERRAALLGAAGLTLEPSPAAGWTLGPSPAGPARAGLGLEPSTIGPARTLSLVAPQGLKCAPIRLPSPSESESTSDAESELESEDPALATECSSPPCWLNIFSCALRALRISRASSSFGSSGYSSL